MAKTPNPTETRVTNRKPELRTLAKGDEFRQTEFKDRNLLLFDVFRGNIERTGDPLIRGLRFENCHIEGPAVLLPLSGCTFNDCNFGMAQGDMKNLVLYPASTEKVTGAIPMINCVFEAVDFFSIGFTGQRQFLDSLLEIEVREA